MGNKRSRTKPYQIDSEIEIQTHTYDPEFIHAYTTSEDPINWITTKYPENTTNSSELSKNLDCVRVGAYPPSDWMLTYDVNLWNPTGEPGHPYQLELKSVPNNCIIFQNEGMGVPETWKRIISQEKIGSYDFRVEQWTDTSSGNIILTVFFYQDRMEIAVISRSDPATCLDAARVVLKYSAENSFGPCW